jgi:hypothetical protein
LERYYLAQGQYPESLAALVPQFADRLPPDVITREPLKYRRESPKAYALYSVGWNLTDDGATVSTNHRGVVDYLNGDWVWRIPAK